VNKVRLLDTIHEGYVYDRRTKVLSDAIAKLVPENARVLDVGCGDGLISKMIKSKRSDISVEGFDVLLRPKTHIPVKKFDGGNIPFLDGSFDTVMFIDVLHHTMAPKVLLSEAVRVSKSHLIIKDHTLNGVFAGPRLRFMDLVGNARYRVSIPCNYWIEKQWRDIFQLMNLDICYWTQNIALYPWWADWLFGSSLHFIACLTIVSSRFSIY
jgi:SAM-dependent methyltransferase